MKNIININLKVISNLSDRYHISKALSLAYLLHVDQKPRPDGPYNNHISRVVSTIINDFGIHNSSIIIGGALHDSVEDQPEKLATLSKARGSIKRKALDFIKNEFGQRVADLVNTVSNPKSWQLLEQNEHHQKYAHHVKKIIKDPEVCLIKLADFMDNGLTLKKIEDKHRQYELVKRYFPIYEIFIDRVTDGDVQLTEYKKIEIIELLSQGKIFAESIIK